MGECGGISTNAFHRAPKIRFGIFLWEEREGQKGVQVLTQPTEIRRLFSIQ